MRFRLLYRREMHSHLLPLQAHLCGIGSLMRCYLIASHAFEDDVPLRDAFTLSVSAIVSLRDWISHVVLSDDFACVRERSAAERCIDFSCLYHRISPANGLSCGAIRWLRMRSRMLSRGEARSRRRSLPSYLCGTGSLMWCCLITSHAFKGAPPLRDAFSSSAL
jgi:hypothetical protein